MDKEKECPDFKLDDWGVCKYKYNWFNEDCEENCLLHKENQSSNQT